MNTRRTDPHYSTLPQRHLDSLTELVDRFGYAPTIAAIGDILTQDPKAGMQLAPELSLLLGNATAAAEDLFHVSPKLV